MIDPFALADLLQIVVGLVLTFGQLDDGNVPAHGFHGGITEDSLGGLVPARDHAVQGLADDGVVRRLDDVSEQRLAFLRRLPVSRLSCHTSRHSGCCTFALIGGHGLALSFGGVKQARHRLPDVVEGCRCSALDNFGTERLLCQPDGQSSPGGHHGGPFRRSHIRVLDAFHNDLGELRREHMIV